VIIAGTESNSISVAWDYSCIHRKIRFKVYAEHREFIACQTGQKDISKGPGFKDLEVTDERSVDINGLHPYSNYKVSIAFHFWIFQLLKQHPKMTQLYILLLIFCR
jgi:hypothetical protein